MTQPDKRSGADNDNKHTGGKQEPASVEDGDISPDTSGIPPSNAANSTTTDSSEPIGHLPISQQNPPAAQQGYHPGGPWMAPPPPAGPYSEVMSKARQGASASQYPPPPPYHEYQRPIPVRAHDAEYRSHPPPSHYYPPPWMGSDGQPIPPAPHHHMAFYSEHYSQSSYPPAPYRYPYPPPPPPPATHNTRHDENNPPRSFSHETSSATVPAPDQQSKVSVQPPSSTTTTTAATGNGFVGRQGATSPSQIERSHREEVTNMGCTCKKTKCLKLYCQCFAAQIYCGPNCRCLACFNTVKYEKQRKDAMRVILSRNPTAFDTKFFKSNKDTAATAKDQPKPILTHKLGCKCRKSACMKKYCECFAGGVKCGLHCRCTGCKNRPSNDSGNGSQDNPGSGTLLPAYDPTAHQQQVHRSPPPNNQREPWMMNAAQNLAFLKHGPSPSVDRPVATVPDSGEVASMPSLAASSSDTSPDDRSERTSSSKVRRTSTSAVGEPGAQENSLLLAAMAMTEFQAQPRRGSSRSNTTAAEGSSNNNSPDSKHPEEAKDQLKQEPATKRPAVPRASPKRKSADNRRSSSDFPSLPSDLASSPESKPTMTEADDSHTPLDPREMKRTRLGSVRKKMTWADLEQAGGEGTPENETTKMESNTIHQTPDQQKATNLEKLTPVSARCIDFKRMHVNDVKK